MKQNQKSPATHYLANGQFSFSFENLLGKGATGNVYKGLDHKQNKHVAIKVIETGKMNQVEKSLIENEKQSLKILKHQNIMKLHHIEEQSDFTFIISQIYEGGSLKEYLEKKGRFCEQEAMQFFRKIIQGYCAVVEANIIHRDLKPTNILLSASNEPVIIDFGYSQVIIANKNLTVFNVGSPSYMSPEAYNKTIYSQKSDIWSLGAIFYELLMNTTLDNNVPIKQYFQNLTNSEYPPINFDLFGDVSKQILKGTLAVKPEQRITSHRIKYLLDKEIIGKRLCSKVMSQPISSQLNHPKHQNYTKSMKNFEFMVKDIDFSKLRGEEEVKNMKRKPMTMKAFSNFAVPINPNQQTSIKMIPMTSAEAIQGMIKNQSGRKISEKSQREFNSSHKIQTGYANNTPSISRIDFKSIQVNRNSISTINYVQRRFDGSNSNMASNLVMGSRELSKNTSTLQISNFPVRSNDFRANPINNQYFNQSIQDASSLTYNQGFSYAPLSNNNNISMISSVDGKPLHYQQDKSLSFSSQPTSSNQNQNSGFQRQVQNQYRMTYDYNTLQPHNSDQRITYTDNLKEKTQVVNNQLTESYQHNKFSQSDYSSNMSQKRNENSQFKLSFKTMTPVSYVDMREGQLKNANRPKRPQNNFESQNVLSMKEKTHQYHQSQKSYQDFVSKHHQINQSSLYQKAHYPPRSGNLNQTSYVNERLSVQNQIQNWNHQSVLQFQPGLSHMRNSSESDSRNVISMRKLI